MIRLDIHPDNPQKRSVQQAADLLLHDGILVYPTDSGYSIGCNAESSKAIQKLYHLKKPLKKYVMALLVPNFSVITEYAKVNNLAFKLMKKYMPGPYTFILPAQSQIARKLDVKRKEIGIRTPSHPFLTELFKVFPHPILNTAAKVSEDEYFTQPDDLEELFQYTADMMITCGEIPVVPTTIVSLVNNEIEVIRGEFEG
jgi:tRNA threonylcarbamoyl adenosine modification protein (Sua5/YciO/YrdC/YwlC family)